MASPTYYRIEADVPRHAPRTPASGPRTGAARSWPPRARSPRCALGRLDERDDRERRLDRTAAAAGRTSCPSAARCWPRRARSTTRRVEAVVAEMVDRCTTRRNEPECECDVDVTWSALFAGYRHRPGAPRSLRPRRRCAPAATRPREIVTGGGSDANALRGRGLPLHEPRQRHASATTSRPSASASRRWRACSTWRSRCSTRSPRRDAPASCAAGRSPRRRRRRAASSAWSSTSPGRGPRAAIADVGARRRRASWATRSWSTRRRATSRSAPAASTSCTSTSRAAWAARRGRRARDEAQLHARCSTPCCRSRARELAVPLRPAGRRLLAARPARAARLGARARARRGARLGYVQTAGGALPGGHSRRRARAARARAARRPHHRRPRLRRRGRGDHDRRRGRTTACASCGWDAAVCGPGPGILGSASALGHGGMSRSTARTRRSRSAARSCSCARMSSGDPRERHRGLSPPHRAPCSSCCWRRSTVAVPPAARADGRLAGARGHEVRELRAPTSTATAASGLPARTMGRDLDEDRCSSRAALAAGAALARQHRGDEQSRDFEHVGGETVCEGHIIDVRVERFRYADGEEVEREIVRHPGAVGVVAHDGERRLARAPAARGGGRARPARDPRRQAGRARASRRSRRAQARAGRGDRQGAPSTWEHAAHVLVEPGLHRRGGPRLPRHRPRDDARRGRRERAHRDRPLAARPTSTTRSRASSDAKTLIGLLELRALGCA